MQWERLRRGVHRLFPFQVSKSNYSLIFGVKVPLILAYALSVHKSQGQTLERLRVDLRRTFEKGQGMCFAKNKYLNLMVLRCGSIRRIISCHHDGTPSSS